MSKFRRTNNQVDANQKEIVAALRKITGVQVVTGMDDILVGYNGVNYWVEIKVSEAAAKQKSKTTEKQRELDESWAGHYLVAWTLDQILEDMGILRKEDSGD